MSTGLTTLAIKARLANYIRKTLYKRKWEDIKTGERDQIFKEIFDLNHAMHWELNAYKDKRRDKRELLAKRKAAPQTKSMKKKLGLIKKTPLKDPRLEN